MKRIFLIGYMGAGKTTVGKELARQMGLSFVDLDHYIEGRYHKTVTGLFEEKGEDAFRGIEQKLLREVASFEDVIVSTGGGTPCFFDNMSFMNQTGTTVYLTVSPEELTKRLELVKHTRPILKGRFGEELKTFVKENLDKREPWYKQASIVFDAEVMLTDNDVLAITGALKEILT
ncbi:MAG: shikimate kinase [Tannerellaceae bacterium]|jgi:shikimate kinase|nr:shikimate kinase [Tannerellaceae bacterium]